MKWIAAIILAGLGMPQADAKWLSYEKCELVEEAYFDGDSFKVKARGASKKNRYYCVIIGANGQRLDEALLEAGLARAHGVGVEWPERMTKERFLRKLNTLENSAKREKKGVWGG